MEKNSILLAPDLEISRIVTGLWQLADIERHGKALDPHVTSKHMGAYADAGLTSFDMADHYGSSEIIAGTFKNNYHGSKPVQLFTKWVPKPGKITRENVQTAVDLALDRMQQPSLDLMQFHAWHYPDSRWLDGLFYLQELQQNGVIKHIGVTNFDAAHLNMALATGIPIISNQVCHSVIDRRAHGSMANVCKKYNVKLMAFGALAGGFLTDKWLGRREPEESELTTWSEMKYKRFIEEAGGWDPFQNLLQSLRAIANKHSLSIANIACRYVLENPAVGAIIIGARLGQSEHVAENIRLLNFSLDSDDLQQIEMAQSHLKSIPGDCGDEYRKPPFLTASGDLSHHLDAIPKPFDAIRQRDNRDQVFSGTSWEGFAGYCRAVKDGKRIMISGTTASHGDRLIGGGDPAAQMHFVIDKIEGAIHSLGGALEDVVRTRIFVHNIDDWEPIAGAHGERFRGINPANTLVGAKLVGDGYLVEMEAEATLP